MPAKNKIQIEIDVTSNGEILLKTADGVEQFGKRSEEAAKGSKILDGAMERIGQKATDLVAQLPAMIVDLGKLGVQSEATAFRFEKFAGSEERATELLGAFVDATDNTISRMDAMAGAGRLLQMGLVSNADEMSSVAAMATKLGDQTMDAGDRVADFAALLANQSIPRLDNFGISSGRVRNRIKELQAATKDMSREEAFKIAVMEEGQKSLDTLGDSTELAKVKVDKLTAAFDDAKVGIGEMIAEIALGSVEVDGLAERIRLLPETINQIGIITSGFTEMIEPVSKVGKFIFDWLTPIGLVMQGVGALGKGLKNAFDAATPAIAKALAGTDAVRKAVEDAYPPVTELSNAYDEHFIKVRNAVEAQNDYKDALNISKSEVGDSVPVFDQYSMAIAESMAAQDNAAIAAVDYKIAQEALRIEHDALTLATKELAASQLDLAANLMDASSAQIAQAAITELKAAYDAGDISIGQYNAAVSETQLAFGLATPESMALATGITNLTTGLGEGKVSAGHFNESLAALIVQAELGTTGIKTLSDGITAIPNRKVDIEINVRKTGYGGTLGGESAEAVAAAAVTGDPSGGLGGAGGRGFAKGADFTVPPGFENDSFGPLFVSSGERVTIQPRNETNNYFNQTINSRASTEQSSGGFRMMQSMVGQ